jgi:hypothetical protein
MTLQGSWYIGPVPKGRRAFTQFGGDLLLLSVGGLLPVSYITRGGAGFLQASEKEYISKIQEAMQVDLAASFNQYGWEVVYFERESLIVITVPDYSDITNRQYALGTIIYGWTQFNGMPIKTMANISGFVMTASSSAMNINFTVPLDNVAIDNTGGVGITGQSQPAFSAMGYGANKHWLMGRITLLSPVAPGIAVQLNIDYQDTGPTTTPSIPANTQSLWDTATWDSGIWSGGLATYQPWFSVAGEGYSGSLASIVVSQGGTIYARTDYMYEEGGAL